MSSDNTTTTRGLLYTTPATARHHLAVVVLVARGLGSARAGAWLPPVGSLLAVGQWAPGLWYIYI